jgi:DNA-binding Lrp family transcriptional regulator
MTPLQRQIVDLLTEDARRDIRLLAVLLGEDEAVVRDAVQALEDDRVIVKYAAVCNWSKIDPQRVTALIEVTMTPERGRGFDAMAEHMYLYPEVRSVYLMSGAYDLLVEVEGANLRDIATFVSSKLSTIERVLATKTFFVLKKYKQDGIIFEQRTKDERMSVTP